MLRNSVIERERLRVRKTAEEKTRTLQMAGDIQIPLVPFTPSFSLANNTKRKTTESETRIRVNWKFYLRYLYNTIVRIVHVYISQKMNELPLGERANVSGSLKRSKTLSDLGKSFD